MRIARSTGMHVVNLAFATSEREAHLIRSPRNNANLNHLRDCLQAAIPEVGLPQSTSECLAEFPKTELPSALVLGCCLNLHAVEAEVRRRREGAAGAADHRGRLG